MSETLYNQFKWVVETLCWEEFQLLCYFYLKDINYNCNLPKIPGRDWKHDIYGTGGNGPFIAHCTIQDSSLENKLFSDISEGVRSCKDLSEVKREILFFSRKRVFVSPIKTTTFIESIIPKLIEIDQRYSNKPPVISLISGDQLARVIASWNEQKQAFYFVKKQIANFLLAASVDDQSSVEEDTRSYPSCSEDKFVELLSKYSDSLPVELRQELLRDIVASAWNTIVYHPFFAISLLNNETIIQKRIAHILVPLCKAALRMPISPNELKVLLRSIDDNYFFLNGYNKNLLILIKRTLKFLFYDQPDALKSNEIKEELERLVGKGEIGWNEFFTDLYFRHVCNYISIDSELLSIIKSVFDRYLQEQAKKPLALLWPMISAPLEVCIQHKKDDLIELIRKIAKVCESVTECRWCVSALLRIMPLYNCSEEELDYCDLVSSLIKEFDPSLASKSSFLQFIYLENLLRAFIRKKDPKFLDAYEKQFINSLDKLLPIQVSHLQMEYASCLYVCCQFLDKEVIRQLGFGEIVLAGKNPLDNSLFRSHLLGHKSDLEIKLSLTDKGTFFKWLVKYTGLLYRLYAKNLIEQNHLRALQFKASICVYQNHPAFCNSALASLQRSIEPLFDYHPSFYAKSTAVFSLVPRNQHIDLMRKYVVKGLQADKYSILMNAKDIAQCLYSCYYYGECNNRVEIDRFADSLAKATEVGVSKPKLHWAYYAGIKYQKRTIDREFLNELWNCSKNMTKKIHQLSLKKGAETGIIFPDTIIKNIKSYTLRDSLFAAVLSNDLTNPEVWNIIGTTVFNNRGENDLLSLEMAAHFYSFAKCFVRTRKDYDQKYCYNYIRCKALAYKTSGSPPEEFYIRDVVFYLKKPEASFFSYRKECIEPYIDILKTQWDNISDETRKFISESLLQIGWIQKLLKNSKFEFKLR